MMANVQLSQEKEVAEFYRLEIELRIFNLKEQNLSYKRESLILMRIEKQITEIDQHISKNAKDNYWAWEGLEDEEG